MSIKSNSSRSLNGEQIAETDSNVLPNLDENAPRPRLCHLKKWPDFQGYGFNLHAERSKLTQHIGKVDANSPAESAGLREGDRIIEVNFVNISNENHQQVVKRIRNGLELNGQLFADQVVLLVLDPGAEEYYKQLNIVVKHTFSNVLRLETVEHQTKTDLTPSTEEEHVNNKLEPSVSSEEPKEQEKQHSRKNSNSNSDINNNNYTEYSKATTTTLAETKLSSHSTSSINNNNNNNYNSTNSQVGNFSFNLAY